jgi:hypothetical protein
LEKPALSEAEGLDTTDLNSCTSCNLPKFHLCLLLLAASVHKKVLIINAPKEFPVEVIHAVDV